MAKNAEASARRLARVRRSIKAAANGRPRLSVFRSSKQIYAQIIDDVKGATIVAASTVEKDIRGALKTGLTRPLRVASESCWRNVQSRLAFRRLYSTVVRICIMGV